jgi:glycosyltransferase involved in cell wall biosynthesis
MGTKSVKRLCVALDARPAAGALTGTGLMVMRLAEYLAQHDVECYLLYDREPAYRLNVTKVNSVIIPPTGVGRASWEQRQLPGVLRRLAVRLYHATWNYGVPLRAPCPVVLTIHDVIPLVMQDAFPNTLGGRVSLFKHWAQMILAATQAQAILADSHSTADDVIRLLRVSRRKIRVVWLGLDRPVAATQSREAIAACVAGHRLIQPYLLYLGGMDRRKNLLGLVRAYARLRQQRGDAPFLIIAGEKIAQYAQVAALVRQLGLNESVTFTGYLPRDEMWTLLAGAEGLVYPSLYEGFGFPPLEAMVCGTPVITSNAGALPEIVGDAALLINPRDEAELAAAMARLLDDRALRNDLVRRGKLCAQKFSWEEYGKQMLEIYQQVSGE